MDLTKCNLVYLATPYDAFPEGHAAAWFAACVTTTTLLKRDINVISPIVHGHHLSGRVPFSRADWLEYDERLMRVCDAIIVAMFDGWKASKGIDHEVAFFKAAAKPVVFFDLERCTLVSHEPLPAISDRFAELP